MSGRQMASQRVYPIDSDGLAPHIAQIVLHIIGISGPHHRICIESEGFTGICMERVFVSQGPGIRSSPEEAVCLGMQVSGTLR